MLPGFYSLARNEVLKYELYRTFMKNKQALAVHCCNLCWATWWLEGGKRGDALVIWAWTVFYSQAFHRNKVGSAFFTIFALFLSSYCVSKRFSSSVLLSATAFLLVAVFFGSCRNDDFEESPDFRLEFSVDTVFFDTLFNTIGSATRTVKVYNRSKDPVRISALNVENDPNNSYRINVDGLSGTTFTDVEILGDDSLFIFIEVTVDPGTDELYPFVDGALRFTTNGNEQRLPLVAWGWDAVFYPRAQDSLRTVQGLPPFYTISDVAGTITWTADRPIVIRNYLVIDEAQRLNIEPGTQIHFHQGGGLWVFTGGSITALGTLEAPVFFQGDRLESFYDEEPGQWDRIWINEGSLNNRLENVIIKNNFIGLQVEPFPGGEATDQLSTNRLEMKNVVVRNNSIASLFVRNYRIDAENLLLSRAGQHVLVTQGAGQYRFDQCTFANNWNLGIRQTPSVFLSNLYPVDQNTVGVGTILSSRFRNCIIYGNGFNEFAVEFDTDNANVDLEFTHCLFRAEEEIIAPLIDEYFSGQNWVGNQPGFVNFSGGDLRLREDAFVRGIGTSGSGLPANDLIGFPFANPRPLGALEFQPE
jgi:hypothetical protein